MRPSVCLRSAASWLRSFKIVRAHLAFLEVLGASPASLFFQDLPDLLAKSAAVLERSPLPLSIADWPTALIKLESGSLLRIVPHLGAAFLLLTVVLAGTARGLRASLGMRPPDRRTFWLARMLLVRGMALIYLAAFATSAAQSRAHFGSLGLDPALSKPSGRPAPWFDLLGRTDLTLELVSWSGVLLSLLVAGGLVQWAGAQLLLWSGYLSIINLAPRVVIGYGWEWATCEVGFLIVFLTTEWPTRSPFPTALPPPTIVLLLLRWYVFRLLIGAGQSKLGERSSACWLELTCTTTHYFTQPMPNPLAWLAHRLPLAAHKFEVALTFAEQLALPFLILAPSRTLQHFAFLAELALQLGIVGTGNYAWINHIGVLPAVSLLDDAFLAHFFPRSIVNQAIAAEAEVVGSGTAAAAKRDYARLATEEVMPAADEDESSASDGGDGGASNSNLPRVRSGAGGVARVRCYPRAILRSYRCIRMIMHALLALFIACKSAAPLKELFTPAPWLSYYDEYFFVNAQGVFGFINSHRVNLALSFTHDALPSGRRPVTTDILCRDTPGPIANARDGRPLLCTDVAPFCAEHQQLHELCPRTCGRCTQRAWLPSAIDKVAWAPLEFKNLPGDPTRRPFFTSPYHYRLDWETWIQVTASMEHVIARAHGGAVGKAPGQLIDLQVPQLLQTLVGKVLSGDTDAIHLLGTPPEAVLRLSGNKTVEHNVHAGGQPGSERAQTNAVGPTAIRADFYSYTFSSWDALRRDGRWWERRRLSNTVIFEREASTPTSASDADTTSGHDRLRRSPWQRHWLIFGAVMGISISVRALLTSGPEAGGSYNSAGRTPPSTAVVGSHGPATACVRFLNPLCALVAYVLIGALALLDDYPQHRASLQLASEAGLIGYSGVLLLLPPAFAAAALAQLVFVALQRHADAKTAVRSRMVAFLLSVVQHGGLPLALWALARDAETLKVKLASL